MKRMILCTGLTFAALTITQALAMGNDTANENSADQSVVQTLSAQEFVRSVSVTTQFEIESSRLALKLSHSDAVKAFAQQMIDDHTKSGDELQALLPSSRVPPSRVTGKMDEAHRKILENLRAESAGSPFERAYLQAQDDAHRKAIALFRSYVETGNDPALKSFAERTLPVLEGHAGHLKEVRQELAAQ